MSKMLQFNSKTSLSRIKCASIYTVCIVKYRPPPHAVTKQYTNSHRSTVKLIPRQRLYLSSKVNVQHTKQFDLSQ